MPRSNATREPSGRTSRPRAKGPSKSPPAAHSLPLACATHWEELMRFSRLTSTFALAAATVVAACSKKSSDTALQNDLTLAAQQQQAHLDSISALEANNAAAVNAAA